MNMKILEELLRYGMCIDKSCARPNLACKDCSKYALEYKHATKIAEDAYDCGYNDGLSEALMVLGELQEQEAVKSTDSFSGAGYGDALAHAIGIIKGKRREK